ncbi:hypothetical protein ACFVZL_10625 [Streptomyces sp. NPDC058320]|uniref:hypothetical protein n=1 Tax=Streptomyces sp. NPDC058320 TaxID=3346444 RepID=UPI0036F0FE8C
MTLTPNSDGPGAPAVCQSAGDRSTWSHSSTGPPCRTVPPSPSGDSTANESFVESSTYVFTGPSSAGTVKNRAFGIASCATNPLS